MTTNKFNIFLAFLDELCRILQNQGNKIRGFGNGKGKMKNMKDFTLLAVLKCHILVLFKLINYYIGGNAVVRPRGEAIQRTGGGKKSKVVQLYTPRLRPGVAGC